MSTAITVFEILCAIGLGLSMCVLALGWSLWLVGRKWASAVLAMPGAVDKAFDREGLKQTAQQLAGRGPGAMTAGGLKGVRQ